jgi:thiol-disulfide isomerase/thioredoxin
MRRVLSMAILLVSALPAVSGSAPSAPDPAWQALAAHPLAPLGEGSASAPAAAPLPGRPLLLHFWASWCAPCRRELPALDARLAPWQAAGLQLRAISIDREPEKARRFAAELELAMPLYLDSPDGLAKQLDLPALPCSYLFDGDGALLLMLRGEDARGLDALEATVADLLGGGSATPAAAGLGGR